MAFDAFMKISTIPGECTDDKHKDWIELLSFNYGMDQPTHSQTSAMGARSAVRVNVHETRITKLIDFASPKLAGACCTGEHIPEVTIEACRAGGDKQKYLEIKMTNVLVGSVNSGGAAKGEDIPTEEVALNFGTINWTYIKLTNEGKPSGNVSSGWDLVQNKKL
jgi:type VI secretion system secreted protein Hcp